MAPGPDALVALDAPLTAGAPRLTGKAPTGTGEIGPTIQPLLWTTEPEKGPTRASPPNPR